MGWLGLEPRTDRENPKKIAQKCPKVPQRYPDNLAPKIPQNNSCMGVPHHANVYPCRANELRTKSFLGCHGTRIFLFRLMRSAGALVSLALSSFAELHYRNFKNQKPMTKNPRGVPHRIPKVRFGVCFDHNLHAEAKNASVKERRSLSNWLEVAARELLETGGCATPPTRK